MVAKSDDVSEVPNDTHSYLFPPMIYDLPFLMTFVSVRVVLLYLVCSLSQHLFCVSLRCSVFSVYANSDSLSSRN